MVALEDLQGVAFLDGLDDADRQELAAASGQRAVAAGEIVFREGDEADGLYLIRDGAVSVFGHDETGAIVELNVHRAGELFGELALLEGGTRSASVRAVEDSRLVLIGRDAFVGVVARRPEVAMRLLAALSRLVRQRSERTLREQAARREVELQAEIDRHRTLGQMVAGVAHELNTPLGTANTAADIVARRVRSDSVARAVEGEPAARRAIEDAGEAAELLLRNIARAHQLVATFKQVSIQHSSAMVETVDIGRVIAEAIDLFRIDARRAGLTVELLDGRSDRTSPWTGNPGHLTQILLNLLGNVARYAYAAPGGRAEVRLDDAELDGRSAIELAVRDEGAGIAPEDLEKVFEPFFTTGRGRGGSGLGMAIVRSLVRDSLHGTIEIESAVGAGTTVIVRVPHTSGASEGSQGATREEVAMA